MPALLGLRDIEAKVAPNAGLVIQPGLCGDEKPCLPGVDKWNGGHTAPRENVCKLAQGLGHADDIQ